MTYRPDKEDLDLDRTEELPILSEETIAEFERAEFEQTVFAQNPTGPGDVTDRNPALKDLTDITDLNPIVGPPTPAQSANGQVPRSGQDSTLTVPPAPTGTDPAGLQPTDVAPSGPSSDRLSSMEALLRESTIALAALRSELREASRQLSRQQHDDENTRRALTDLDERLTRTENQRPIPEDPKDKPQTGAELRAQLADLHHYIAGRQDHWRHMEARVEESRDRIGELEGELQNRAERQAELESELALNRQALREANAEIERLRTRLAESDARLINTPEAPQPLGLYNPASDEPPATGSPVALGPPQARVDTNHADRQAVPKEGADRPTGAGQNRRACLVGITPETKPQHDIVSERMTIGRGSECDIQITTHFVSRLHAVLTWQDRDLIVEDRGSTNGVFVNSSRVRRATLSNGDWLTIGQARYRVVIESDEN